MSCISYLRFTNIVYNSHDGKARHIYDEHYPLNRKSTLFYLENGGGKSVQVQFVKAVPTKSKKARSSAGKEGKTRAFDDFFKNQTPFPMYVMLEYSMDNSNTKAMAGLMLRKHMAKDDDHDTAYDQIAFIAEYTDSCRYDIRNIPFCSDVTTGNGRTGQVFKTWKESLELFEKFESDPHVKFFHYNLDNKTDSKKYYEKLKEYQIYREEWEDIIYKVNKEEGGLVKYFKDCRNKNDVIKLIFIDTILNRIDPDGHIRRNQIEAVKSYIQEYNINKNTLDNAAAFTALMDFLNVGVNPMIEEMEGYALKTEKEIKSAVALHCALADSISEMNSELNEIESEREDLNSDLIELDRARRSYEYYQAEEAMNTAKGNLDAKEEELSRAKSDFESAEKLYHSCIAAKEKLKLQKAIKDYNETKGKYEAAKNNDRDNTEKIEEIEPLLYRHSSIRYELCAEALNKKKSEKEGYDKDKADAVTLKEKTEKSKDRLIRDESDCENEFKNYGAAESQYNEVYNENLARASEKSIYINEDAIKDIKKKVSEKLDADEKSRNETSDLIKKLEEEYSNNINNKSELETKLGIADSRLSIEKERDKENEEMLTARRLIFNELEYNDDVFDILRFDSFMQKYETTEETKINNAENEIGEKQNRIRELLAYLKGEVSIPNELVSEMRDNGLDPQYALKWFQSRVNDRKKLGNIVRQNPYVPYALIMSSENIRKLNNIQTSNTSFMVPVIKREDAEAVVSDNKTLDCTGNVWFYSNFNDKLLDEEKLRAEIAVLTKEVSDLSEHVTRVKETLAHKREQANTVRKQSLDRKTYDEVKDNIRKYEQNIEALNKEIDGIKEIIEELKGNKKQAEDKLQKLDESVRCLTRKLEDTVSLEKKYMSFCQELDAYEDIHKKLEDAYKTITALNDRIKKLESQIEKASNEIPELKNRCEQVKKEKSQYKAYPDETRDISENEYNEYEALFKALKDKYSGEIKELKSQLDKTEASMDAQEKEYKKFVQKHGLNEEDIESITYTEEIADQYENEYKQADKDYKDASNEQSAANAIYEDKIKAFENAKLKIEAPMEKENIGDTDFDRRKLDIENRISDNEKMHARIVEKRSRHESSINVLKASDVIPMERFNVICAEKTDLESIEDINDHIKGIIKVLKDCKNSYDRVKKELMEKIQAEKENTVYKSTDDTGSKKKLSVLYDMFMKAEDESILRPAKETISNIVFVTETMMKACEENVARDKEDRRQRMETIYHFLEEIDENLNSLDSNSSIKINGENKKMMELETPDWEKNAEIYKANISHFLNELIEEAVKKLNDGTGFNEYVDGKMNIANLYDNIVGVHNIRFTLKKVEKHGVFSYSWDDVLLQSGGENSLAAFIIIANLMNYTRKGMNDYMKDSKEWKVLILDNPFAEMNAEHLLGPMKSIADKLHIQLITWTGHNQSSINQNFDNIINQMIVDGDGQNEQYIVMDKNTSVLAKDERIVNTRFEVLGQETLNLE